MAKVDTESGWMVNFIYEQDLTSKYMNNYMYSVIKPGVYNGGISLSRGSTDNNLYLNVKKGTTLVFSNDYIRKGTGNNAPLFRDTMEYLDTKTDVSDSKISLIKCTALKDIANKEIAVQYSDTNKDYSIKEWYGDTSGSPTSLYLTSFIKYDTEGTTSQTSPEFCLTRNNPSYSETASTDFGKFIYCHTRKDLYDYGTDNGKWMVPDGSPNYGSLETTGLHKFSYLTLGVVTGDKVAESAETAGFTPSWLNTHFLTGRGLWEYRHTMSADNNSCSPDFFIPYTYSVSTGTAVPFSRLYVDFKDLFIYGDVYNRRNDWRSGCGVPYYGALSGTEGTDYVDLTISQNDAALVEFLPSGSKPNVVSMDFVFGSVKCRDNSSDPLSIESKSISLKIHREFIVNDTWVSVLNSRKGGNLCLDTSEDNTRRLTGLIENTGIIPQVIKKMTRNGELDPTKGETLMPIAVVFRAFSKIEKTEGGYTFTSAGDAGGLTSDKRVNPENVLSLIDLGYKMNRMNVMFPMQESYSVIPVIK